jgi:outer membrane protein assembly factor BamB
MTTLRISLLASTLATSFLFTGSALADNMFRGNAAHTGYVSEAAPASFASPAWAFKAKGPVLSSATVDGCIAYFGSDDRNLYAVDVKTGEMKWSFATGGKVRSTPAVCCGTVFFISYDGKVYALNAQTGEKQWEYATGGERCFEAKGIHGCIPATQTMPDFWDVFQSSPAVVNGVVYVGSGDGKLHAIDAKTGAAKWQFATGDVIHSSPAVADGVVYIGSWDTNLYAIDAESGAEIWRFKTGEDNNTHNQTGIQSSPVVKDGTIYFGCRDSNFYALDAKTGIKKWSYKSTWVNCTPAVADGVVCFVTSIPSHFIVLDAATGAEKIKAAAPFVLFSSPWIANGRAYAGCFDGSLYSCGLAQGDVKLEYATQAALDSKSAIYNTDGSVNFGGQIFRCNDFDEMYFTARKLYDAGAIMSSPVMACGSMLFGSSDGCMYCFR